jgi:hypothetical protein
MGFFGVHSPGYCFSVVKVSQEALDFPETLKEGIKINEEQINVAIGRGLDTCQ